jgi:uncharacterized protein
LNNNNWLSRHPIFTYILFTLIWSFSIWSLLFIFIKPGGLMTNPPPISFLFVTLGGFGPSISGLLTTRLIYGKEGVKALFARLRFRGVGRWWFALLIIPIVTALTPVARWLAGYPVDMNSILSLIGPGIGLGLVAGLMEEFGWRGFLLPHLLKSRSSFAATLLLGLIWGGVWHGYADYFGLGGRGLTSLVLIILVGPILLSAWSFILTRVFERTKGNLLVSFFMHASISSSALIFGQKYSSNTEEIIWTSISTGFAILAAVLIWIVFRKTAKENIMERK